MRAVVKASLLVFSILGLLAWLGNVLPESRENPTDTKDQKASVDRRAMRITIAADAAKHLRSSMRDPESFRLERALITEDGAVCYGFRSRNGFGGMNAGYATLSPLGKFATNEMSTGLALWNKHCASKRGDDETQTVGYAAGLHGLFGSIE